MNYLSPAEFDIMMNKKKSKFIETLKIQMFEEKVEPFLQEYWKYIYAEEVLYYASEQWQYCLRDYPPEVNRLDLEFVPILEEIIDGLTARGWDLKLVKNKKALTPCEGSEMVK